MIDKSPEERILAEIHRRGRATSTVLARRFRVTRQAIHLHLKNLVRRGGVLKLGTGRKNTFYIPNEPGARKRLQRETAIFRKTFRRADLDEDLVWQELAAHPTLLRTLTAEVKHIFRYTFTEMLNNAIDHSGSERVQIAVEVGPAGSSFTIVDFGVGVFENIRSKKGLLNEMEALQDLLKGKQTTAPERHSGEGIFFTSKVAERFTLESHRKKLLMDNAAQETVVDDIRSRKGTRVTVSLPRRPKTTLEDVFRAYTNEDFRFDKTRVTVKLFRQGDEYVSRSQAKRLLHALQDFREIVLDFSDVTAVGQGFADEIFRIFARRHPEIKIVTVNCHENVEFMINRAKAALSQ